MKPSIDQRLSQVRCLICVGPGGVGKTSTSAAVAIEAARRGRRTLVLTIDPARRLANALGLPEIGNEERIIEPEAFTRLGLAPPTAPLSAMMLDIKRTWDEVVTKYHPDPEKRQRLLENPLYVAMSTALAGSQEYMAMEKLHALASRPQDPLDLIVLDTPPANHAVDFLEAPNKIIEALDNDATRWLLEPYTQKGRLTKKLFDAGSSFFIRTISRLTGTELLTDLGELLAAFQGMFDGFRARAEAVRALLAAEGTDFWVLSTPSQAAEAQDFWARLSERDLQVGAVILNRATPDPYEGSAPADPAALRVALAQAGGAPELAERIVTATDRMASQAAAERAQAQGLRDKVAGTPVVLLPQRSEDVHDLVGLETLRQGLFG